jgi:hypothetical protein
MRRLLVPLTLIALVMPAAAVGAGGQRIADAPMVTPGVLYFGDTSQITDAFDGSSYREYWKIALSSGDVLTLRLMNESRSSVEGIRYFNVYAAGTDDFNYSDAAHSQEEIGANGYAELVYTASTTGVYPIEFVSNFASIILNIEPGPYEFTAYVQHNTRTIQRNTRTTISGPKRAKRGAKVSLKGRVFGSVAGKVAIYRQLGTGRIKTLGLASIRTNGTYTYSVRLGKAKGLYRFLAAYGGDSTHSGSKSRTILVRGV